MRKMLVELSGEAERALKEAQPGRNRSGRTLRDWLVRSFEAWRGARSSQTSLFGTTIEVDEDVPLLLEALGQVTKRNPDELVEAWTLEAPGDDSAVDTETASVVQLSDDVRGKVA